ncbi:MAG: hypothetical protein HOC91_14940 [Nitrospinaceae bacterium]|nr:hypothetical protein [Nitrospinaceae bacterium]MBT3435097.1 hypothetical protein [Nitrospinaceae bacterium]MBT3819781.1 hypothetical protein [Nitrospinaceae bacterium]MBT4094696.1 hypothetical protein [Nitrospinaceae bacterium]MBT4431804.1 hypothetical protein [Nitrospinaceae bacterium]
MTENIGKPKSDEARAQYVFRFPRFNVENSLTLDERMKDFEKFVIEAALTESKGNVKIVIYDLNIPRRTLNEKMQKHGIDRRDFI